MRKRILSLGLVGLLAAGSSAHATVARVSGMGLLVTSPLGNTYNESWAVDDDSNRTLFPYFNMPTEKTEVPGSKRGTIVEQLLPENTLFLEMGPGAGGIYNPANAWGGVQFNAPQLPNLDFEAQGNRPFSFGGSQFGSLMNPQFAALNGGSMIGIAPGSAHWLFDPQPVMTRGGTWAALPQAFYAPTSGLLAGTLTPNVANNYLDIGVDLNGLGALGLGVVLNLAGANKSTGTTVASNPAAGGDFTTIIQNNTGGFGIGVGGTWKNFAIFNAVDAGLYFDNLSVDDELILSTYQGGNPANPKENSEQDTLKTNGSINFQINLRTHNELSKKQTLLSYLTFQMRNLNNTQTKQIDINSDNNYTDPTDTNLQGVQTLSEMIFGIGSALNMNPSTNTNAVVGAAFYFDSLGDQTTWSDHGTKSNTGLPAGAINGSSSNTDLRLPIFASIETKLAGWFTARAGVYKNLFNAVSYTLHTDVALNAQGQTTTGADQNFSPTISDPLVLSVGLGLNVGGVEIDGVVNNNLFYTGTFLLSGLVNTINTLVSATAHF